MRGLLTTLIKRFSYRLKKLEGGATNQVRNKKGRSEDRPSYSGIPEVDQ